MSGEWFSLSRDKHRPFDDRHSLKVLKSFKKFIRV